jgi:hypothetical protein
MKKDTCHVLMNKVSNIYNIDVDKRHAINITRLTWTWICIATYMSFYIFTLVLIIFIDFANNKYYV